MNVKNILYILSLSLLSVFVWTGCIDDDLVKTNDVEEGVPITVTMKLAGAGGQCLLLPPENGDSDFGIMLYNLGGVIFNLMFSVISGILLWTCHESLNPYLNIFLMLFSGVGICFFLVNGEEYYSDNKRLDMSSPFHVCALTMDLAVALDRLDFDKAHNLISLAEERWNEIIQIYKNEIAMERLFLNLIDNGDKSKIEEAINNKNIMRFTIKTVKRQTRLWNVSIQFPRVIITLEIPYARRLS